MLAPVVGVGTEQGLGVALVAEQFYISAGKPKRTARIEPLCRYGHEKKRLAHFLSVSLSIYLKYNNRKSLLVFLLFLSYI